MQVIYIAFVRIRCVSCIPFVVVAWELGLQLRHLIVLAWVVVRLDDLDEITLAFRADDSMLIPIPLVLTLVTEDQLPLLRWLLR